MRDRLHSFTFFLTVLPQQYVISNITLTRWTYRFLKHDCLPFSDNRTRKLGLFLIRRLWHVKIEIDFFIMGHAFIKHNNGQNSSRLNSSVELQLEAANDLSRKELLHEKSVLFASHKLYLQREKLMKTNSEKRQSRETRSQ